MTTSGGANDYPGAAHDRIWRELVFPGDYRNPQPKTRYHLVVIGAGPAGLVTAIAAAGLGAKVALVERSAMGGDCLNVGCVPSKALLEFTRSARGNARFGEAFEWMRQVRARIAHHDSVERYRALGVDVFLGTARFAGGTTVQVHEQRLEARRVVIATGARAALPPVKGLDSARPLTNESVFDLQRPPRRLAILGAGPVGCELAQAFSRMQVEVHLFEMSERVLPMEAPEASRIVAHALERGGVVMHLGAAVSKVERRSPDISVLSGETEVLTDEVLVAAGRLANIEEMNLEVVGVETGPMGRIKVDRYLRTTNPNVYAAGDVCSAQQFTHNADAHARIVVQNTLFAPTATTRKLIIPHCTYTDPELAQVGRRSSELEATGTPFDVHRVSFRELDRGQAEGDAEGFTEVLCVRGSDKILGATIVAHDAGEQIAALCVAMANNLGLGAFGKTILPYPTRSEFLRRLADGYNRTRLTPLARRLMRTWFKWSA